MAEAHLQPAGHPTDRLLGTSPAMAALRAQIRHLASFDVVGSPHVPTILLQGETGTGKGLVAHVIHDSGPRTRGPFIEVNCAAIPATMLEAELFGFEAGAFTDAKRAKPGLLEAASGGTLFLDEVDALPLALQAKLLTVIESRRVRRLGAIAERTVDVKLIAATNAVLSEAVAAERFRADLYHRLAVVVLALPPLRARGEDVVALAESFLQHYTAAHRVSSKRLSAVAAAWLQAYAWPGNVRELSHVMERVTLLHVGEEVDATTLTHLCQLRTPPAAGDEAAMTPREREPASSESAEAAQIRQALTQTGGNVARAARLLGVSRDTVRYRMQRYGLARPRSAAPPSPPATAGSPVRLHAPEAGLPGPPASGERQMGYASMEPAEDPTLPYTRRGRERLSSEAMASQRVTDDVTIELHLPDAEAAWEQKPVAVLALEVTWPEATGLASIRYDPWTEQARWQQAMVDKVQGFGGVLIQRAPALLTWVFGLPQTLEQLPQRAVHSALALRQMVAEARTSDLAVAPEVRLAVHLGAVRWDGRADARTASLLAVGDTMARPVRLLGQAGAGEVVVSPEVGRSVEGLVALEMHVGGYAVLGVSHGRTALASGRPVRSPFVGRAREFALLAAVLEQVQAGRGQVVGLMGVPGIGKSRLLEEFRRSLADKRVTYLEARCLAYGSAIPYLPVRDLLQDHCEISETDSHEVMAEKVRLVLQQVGMDPEEGEPYLLHLLGVPLGTERLASLHPKALKARTFEILQELSVHGSWRQPLILVVEDLQWIDTTSEEFLTSLVERMGSAPILLLVTYRPEYRPPWMGKSYVSQLALSPLAAQDSLCLVRAVLQTTQVPAALEQLLLAKAEGNPFFLEELLQGLLEQGVVGREAGGMKLLADQSHAPPMTAIPLPPTVQAVLAARIDRLPPAAKRLLQMAAVVGMEVPFTLLRAMAQLPEETLRSGLTALHTAEFLYETGFFPESTYTFKHALTQEVAYRSLLPARRQALHEAIGSAIEALYPERIDEQCELLAHHFTRGGNVAKAVHYLATSGQRAVRLFAYEQAVAFFQEALGHIEGHSDREALRRKEVEILLELELVYDNLARRGEQRRLLEQLIHSAQALDDPELLSDAYIRRSQFLSVCGAVEDALAEAERALTLRRRVGDQRGEAKALRAMGFIYWQLRRYEDALGAHRQALEVHREVGDRVAASVELFNLGEILRQLQQHQEALQCLEEARQLLSALEDPLGLALCYYNIGNVYRDLGEYETALRYYQETLASRLRLPHGTSTLWCAPFMGIAMIQSQLGDHREALKYYQEALAISERLGDHRDMVATLQPLAATLEILGEVSDALTYYQQALALSQELGDRHAERSILTSLGHLYRRQLRDFPTALASYRQSLAIDREIGDEDGRLTVLKGLGATCWNLGLYEEAASAFEQALVIVETNGDRAEQAVIRSSLGVTESSLYRYATALAHLQEGLAIAKALGDPQAEGYIMNALGNVYYEIGDQRRAQDCYQQAIQLRRRIRDRRGEGWSLHYLGRSHAEVGEIEAARRLQEQALNLADEIGDAELQVGARLALAAVHCHLGGRGAAKASLRYAQQAVELSRVNGLHREESVGLSQQAMALLLLSKVEAARCCSEEAIQRLEEAGGPANQRERIWLHHAQILWVCGQKELADGYFRRAYDSVMERLAIIGDLGVRELMPNARLLQKLMGEHAKGGPHDVTVSG